jgi:hypothetical protein
MRSACPGAEPLGEPSRNNEAEAEREGFEPPTTTRGVVFA